MTAEIKILPHAIHDHLDAERKKHWAWEDAQRRADDPETRIREIKEGLRWLEARGMIQEANDIWHEFYLGARK